MNFAGCMNDTLLLRGDESMRLIPIRIRDDGFSFMYVIKQSMSIKPIGHHKVERL
jgi:hypothetical protein